MPLTRFPTLSEPAPSPAMDAILARIDREAALREARKQQIDTDPRVVRLRAMRDALKDADGALDVFARMADGTFARRHRIAALVRARIAQLDFPHTSSTALRVNLRDAAATRRQHHVVVSASPDMVVLDSCTAGARADAAMARVA